MNTSAAVAVARGQSRTKSLRVTALLRACGRPNIRPPSEAVGQLNAML